jgi:hypothetical protein
VRARAVDHRGNEVDGCDSNTGKGATPCDGGAKTTFKHPIARCLAPPGPPSGQRYHFHCYRVATNLALAHPKPAPGPRDGQLPEFFLARETAGRLRPAGTAAFGRDRSRREQLLEVLRAHERSRRGAVRWCEPVVEVTGDCHGRPDGPVRDAVLREVRIARN